jgi:tRNA threonylcarbamoyl adenosine modification protein (Sua5/YciO/YrdC/YwlC family)
MSELLKIHPENPSPRDISKIVECLENDGVIIYPTDTVYTIGCSLNSSKALERVAQLKGMKLEKADFSILFYDLSQLSEYTTPISTPVYKLLKRTLPGPYTYILNANNNIPKLFKRKKTTVGIRIPDNAIPIEIVKELGVPIVSSSIHDKDDLLEYTTDPELIFERYRKQVDIVIDGGFGDNSASTVIDATQSTPEVIREGKGPVDDL